MLRWLEPNDFLSSAARLAAGFREMEPREEPGLARLVERGAELSELAYGGYFGGHADSGDGRGRSHPPEEFPNVHGGLLGSDQAEQAPQNAHNSEHDRAPREDEESARRAALRQT